MASSSEQERRQHHRIRFPISERPAFLIASQSFAVIDVSARGLQYIMTEPPLPAMRENISGILQFRRGTQVAVEGVVVRSQNERVALHLNREIPFSILLAEQRYLHARYPMWS